MVIGQASGAAVNWGTLAAVAFSGGSISSGDYVFALAVTAPIFMFFDFNLRAIRATDHPRDHVFDHYIVLRAVCLLVALSVCIATALTIFESSMLYVGLAGFLRAGESMSNLAYGNFQRWHVAEIAGLSMILRSLIAAITVIPVAFVSSGDVTAVLITFALVSIVWALSWDVRHARKLEEGRSNIHLRSPRSDGETTWSACTRIMRRAYPMGFDSLFSSLTLNVPRYLLDSVAGRATLGVYGLIFQAAYSLQLIVGPIGHVGVASLSKLNLISKIQFLSLLRRLLVLTVCFSLPIALGVYFLLPLVLSVTLGPEYNRPALVAILLLASILTAIQRMLGRALQAIGHYWSYTICDLAICLVSAFSSYYLIAKSGAEGAATAVAISFVVGIAIAVLLIRWPSFSQNLSLFDRSIKSPNQLNE